MRQRVKRFLSIFCIMTVIASLVTVMPVSAEEVQGTETESVEVSNETEDESVTEEAATQTAIEEPAVSESAVMDDITTEEPEAAAEPKQTIHYDFRTEYWRRRGDHTGFYVPQCKDETGKLNHSLCLVILCIL